MLPGLYIHVPFCRSKCPYCAFYSIPSSSLIPIWLDGLKKEALLYKGQFDRFDSLYIGGGTPTFLSRRTLAGMMEHLFTHFDFAPDSEITIEANPCDLSDDKIRMLRELGFNRVSLGVQSFDDAVLRCMGRRHTAEEAKKALARLRLFGFDNVGVDLIYGLEEQSLKEWIDTLNCALSFHPEHISCYELTLEKKTVFGRLQQEGKIQPLSEEDGRSYFLTTSQVLTESGYIHYEISNFARNHACRSRHNRKYWQHVPYLGLGPSAHSFLQRDRWWNVRSVREYCAALGKGLLPVKGRETLTDEQLRLESLALGLRIREGVDLRHIASVPQSGTTLSRMEAAGLVKVMDGRIIPTEEGFLVADHLPVCFFP
ncbi:MAG: radical SAM family heme chaperone HemW [Proteobacteria bacterium]|nr:radical SAM family heme chaperone HemW [Pseudomonadota bacterium]